MSSEWTTRIIPAPAGEVRRRLAATTDTGVTDDDNRRGTLTPASRRVAVRVPDAAPAWIEVTPLSPTTALVEIAGAEARGRRAAAAAVDALFDPPVQARPSPAPARSWGRHRSLAAVLAVVVAVAGFGGYRLLAPPRPMDMATAVAQFQTAAPQPARSGTAEATDRVARAARSAPSTAGERRPSTPASRAEPPARRRAAPRTGPTPEPQGATAAGTEQSRRDDRPQRRDVPPDAGVYRYATEGYEEVNRPGGHHEYPAETPFTVQHTPCGFTTRWQPLDGRWDEMALCSGRIRTVERISTQREFYGQRQRSDYRCEPGSRAWHHRPGATWTTRCADEDTTVVTKSTILGDERIRVGTTVIDAVHLQLRAELSGATRGQWSADRWLHPETGLLLRLEAQTTATSQTPAGTIEYHEEVRLDLQSLDPQR